MRATYVAESDVFLVLVFHVLTLDPKTPEAGLVGERDLVVLVEVTTDMCLSADLLLARNGSDGAQPTDTAWLSQLELLEMLEGHSFGNQVTE
jgi:hypothetical protein